LGETEGLMQWFKPQWIVLTGWVVEEKENKFAGFLVGCELRCLTLIFCLLEEWLAWKVMA